MTIIEQARVWRTKCLPNPPPNMISPWWSVSLDVTRAAWSPSEPVRMRPAFGCGHPAVASRRCPVPDDLPIPTGPEAVKAISHIEAEGKMKEYNDMLAENEDLRAGYERAHELYLAFRHEIALALEDSEEHIEGTSAGGMPVRVKCLHALLAQTLVMGEGANPIGDMALSAIKHEFDPAVCRCAVENEE